MIAKSLYIVFCYQKYNYKLHELILEFRNSQKHTFRLVEESCKPFTDRKEIKINFIDDS